MLNSSSSDVSIDEKKLSCKPDMTKEYYRDDPYGELRQSQFKVSRCRIAAFLTVVSLIILDMSTAIVVHQNNIQLQKIANGLCSDGPQIKDYPLVTKVISEDSQHELNFELETPTVVEIRSPPDTNMLLKFAEITPEIMQVYKTRKWSDDQSTAKVFESCDNIAQIYLKQGHVNLTVEVHTVKSISSMSVAINEMYDKLRNLKLKSETMADAESSENDVPLPDAGRFARTKIPDRVPGAIDLWDDGENDQSARCMSLEKEVTHRANVTSFYTLYTPVNTAENPDLRDVHLVDDTKFEMKAVSETELKPSRDLLLAGRKMVIYVHGFRDSSHEKANMIRQLFQKTSEYNLIMLDWRVLAKHGVKLRKRRASACSWLERNFYLRQVGGSSDKQKMFDFSLDYSKYPEAWKSRHAIAEELSHLLQYISRQISAKDIHLVGHSLGAHIAGEAAYYFFGKTFTKIGRITGLDPASVCFEKIGEREQLKQLDKSDADFVDVWHTNTNNMKNSAGINRPAGHIDYWVNGGKYQPACKRWPTFNRKLGTMSDCQGELTNGHWSPCSHSLVKDYFVDSIARCSSKIDSTPGFKAIEVSTLEMFEYQRSANETFPMPASYNATASLWNLGGDKLTMGFHTDMLSHENIVYGSGSGSGDIIQPTSATVPSTMNSEETEIWNRAWKESTNYLVFTDINKLNPSTPDKPDRYNWTGYCFHI